MEPSESRRGGSAPLCYLRRAAGATGRGMLRRRPCGLSGSASVSLVAGKGGGPDDAPGSRLLWLFRFFAKALATV
jgi:hypothetical protein